ncbi:MAG: 3-oxoacyl-[acyl-carrier-protein] reductase [Rickettsiales bacterium]
MFSLTGKNALVTGATGGLGHAIARKLHAAGATVVISGTRENVLQELAAEFKERVHIATANLKESQSVLSLYAKAEELTGGLNILVCNAGVTRDNLMIRMSEEEWDEVITVNLKSAFLLGREAMKAMTKRRQGRIINIASVVGESGNFGQANYSASKAGMIGMTKSMALEGASRGVTANCIAPGFIKTPMTDAIRDDIKEKILAKIPVGIFGEPDDVANAALFLASDEARLITGHTIDVNGGMYMR